MAKQNGSSSPLGWAVGNPAPLGAWCLVLGAWCLVRHTWVYRIPERVDGDGAAANQGRRRQPRAAPSSTFLGEELV